MYKYPGGHGPLFLAADAHASNVLLCKPNKKAFSGKGGFGKTDILLFFMFFFFFYSTYYIQ